MENVVTTRIETWQQFASVLRELIDNRGRVKVFAVPAQKTILRSLGLVKVPENRGKDKSILRSQILRALMFLRGTQDGRVNRNYIRRLDQAGTNRVQAFRVRVGCVDQKRRDVLKSAKLALVRLRSCNLRLFCVQIPFDS